MECLSQKYSPIRLLFYVRLANKDVLMVLDFSKKKFWERATKFEADILLQAILIFASSGVYVYEVE